MRFEEGSLLEEGSGAVFGQTIEDHGYSNTLVFVYVDFSDPKIVQIYDGIAEMAQTKDGVDTAPKEMGDVTDSGPQEVGIQVLENVQPELGREIGTRHGMCRRSRVLGR